MIWDLSEEAYPPYVPERKAQSIQERTSFIVQEFYFTYVVLFLEPT